MTFQYEVSPDRPFRPSLMARHHVVVSGHYWASQAGFQILEAGGNAIDAGVATGLAIDVLESNFVGFGGVAPSMLYLAERNEVLTISGVGTWPKLASAEYFHQHHGGKVPNGILQTVVPAAPAIWLTALERFGTMSFGQVAAAAIRFARDGFPMYPMYLEVLESKLEAIRKWPTSVELFLPGGKLPMVGENFLQTELGATLQYMADQEAAQVRHGRAAGLKAAWDAFYRGDIARHIVRWHEDNGGLLRADDLAGFAPDVEKPQRIRFGDYDVYGCGPWSQGPMLLQALNLLEGLDLKGMGHNSAAYLHALAEALKLAAADREAYFGDPKLVDVPLDELLSKAYAAQRRTMLRPDRAWPEMPPAGAAGGRQPGPWTPDPSAPAVPKPVPAHERMGATSYLCVADRQGNIFSATPSDGAMNGPIVPGTGISPSLWGSRAYTGLDHPARVAPGMRPRMSANPAIAIKPGKQVIPFGSPGSEVLGQAQLQVFLNMAVFGMEPQSAVEAPRFASYSWPESALPHGYLPARLNLEGEIDRATGDQLAAMGHDVKYWPKRKWKAGSVCTIVADQESGVKTGGADYRRTAYAVGW